MTGFVYVIASSAGLYKIGFSTDPFRRVEFLRTSTAEDLELLAVVKGTRDDEKELHRLLYPWRVKREWFAPCRAIHKLIEMAALPVYEPLSAVEAARLPVTTWAEYRCRKGFAHILATALNAEDPSKPLTRQAVLQWVTEVPAKRARLVARITGLPVEELCPSAFLFEGTQQ